MSLPWPLRPENTKVLRQQPTAGSDPVAITSVRPTRWHAAARWVVASGPGRRARSQAAAVVRRLLLDEIEQQQRQAGDIHDLSSQLQRLDHASSWYADASRRDTNLQLLKAEVRSLGRTMEELGMQLAPATGLAGVGARFGELREQVNAASRRLQQLDKAVRTLESRPRAATDDTSPDDTPHEAAASGVEPGGSPFDDYFDYVAFEQRFRGDAQHILAIQQERYETLLAAHAPVLDWGCGRGELLELLASKGIDVLGVEIDPGMVAEARSRGLTIHQQDAVSYLRTCEPESLGAVFSAHVAEHIPFDALLEVIHTSMRALRPGGVFVAETPNPASLIVPSNSFILDPTHLRPIHPSLFAFACETAGFRDVRLGFYAPATGYHLEKLDAGESPASAVFNANVDRLNNVLFGPQEYSVIATKAPSNGSPQQGGT